ncbi:hypothetical protein STENM327S_06139 [Streptomyces tendae]
MPEPLYRPWGTVTPEFLGRPRARQCSAARPA